MAKLRPFPFLFFSLPSVHTSHLILLGLYTGNEGIINLKGKWWFCDMSVEVLSVDGYC